MGRLSDNLDVHVYALNRVLELARVDSDDDEFKARIEEVLAFYCHFIGDDK